MYLHDIEVKAIKELAETAAQQLASLRLSGDRDGVVCWTMLGRILCQIRRSTTNGIWFNATTADSRYDCVMMSGRKIPGRLVSARFDSESFVEWLVEEIEEAVIRHKILLRSNASGHGSLKRFIAKEHERLLESPEDPLTIKWSTGRTIFMM